MILYLKKLNGVKVYIKNQEKNIGYIKDTILDKNKIQIAGFIINKKGIFNFRKEVLINSIILLDKEQLIIENKNSLKRGKELLKKDYISLNKTEHVKILSQTGQDYGYLQDLYADSTGEIVKAEATQGIIGDLIQGRKKIPILGNIEFSEEFIIINSESAEESSQSGGLSRILNDRR